MKKVIFIIVCLVFSLGFAQKQVVDATGYDEQSEAEKNAITTRDGLKRWVVYSSQNNRFEWWDGVAWYPLGSDAGASIEGILEEGSFATSDRKITIGNAETSIVFDLTEDEEEITFDYLSGTEIDVTNVTANYGSFNSIEVTGAVTGSSFNGVVLDSDIIIHLASETGTGQSMYDIAQYTEVNVNGTANLLHILANNIFL